MKNILEIYKEYKMMPNLAEHQLRVAGVAMQICDALDEDMEIDRDAILKACLLHDMGNIIKFKLDYFPEFLLPEGLEYWQEVKNEYIEKYGNDEHKAAIDIARNLGMSKEVISYIDAIDFQNWCNVYHKGIFSEEICVYADTRVSPHCVVSQKERLEEGEKRYKGMYTELDDKRKTLQVCANNIEKKIFSKCDIDPEDITNESIILYIEKLKKFEI